ncbi:MAG: histidine kinase [Flavobacteriales bacterium]|nr:histidine kinase [Flavobacteriales bacterium]MEB2342403.1 histidine kinase [Flavobacteriia bacterium]
MRGIRALAFLSVLMPAPALLAQDASLVPGLLKEYAAAREDSVRGNTLALISYHLVRSRPDSARLTGRQAMELARRTGSTKVLRAAHASLGWLASEQGELDSAEFHLNKARELADRDGDAKDLASTLLNLGWVAEKRGDQAGALKLFLQALDKAEEARDSVRVATINYAIGISYRKVPDFPAALRYLQRALKVEQALGRRNKVGHCQLAIANIKRDQGDTAQAMQQYSLARMAYAAVADHVGLGLVEENIGDMLLGQSPEKALEHYATALGNYARANAQLDRAYVLRNVGEANLRLGHLEAARTALKEGRAIAVQVKAQELVMDYEHSMADLSLARNDARGVAAHMERFVALKDSLQGEARQHEIARLHTEFETERKEKDNALLREQNRTQEQRLHVRSLQLYGSLALALLAIMAIVLIGRTYRQKKRYAFILERLNTDLEQSHVEISEVNSLLQMKLLRSQMNPHFIYNCLNSAAQMTQEGRQAEALAYLQGFARLLRMVLEYSVRDRVPLEEEVEFLELYLQLEAKRLPGLRYSVKVQEALLDDEAEIPALLVQPFVENALWHGLATKVGERVLQVSFHKAGNELACDIMDNGIGRQASGTKPTDHRSMGIQLTRERLRLLAYRMGEEGRISTFDLKDQAGNPQGTKVTLQL